MSGAVEPETGAEVFERMLAGYHVSPKDQRIQLRSALDELYTDEDTLTAQLRHIILGPVQEQLTLFSPDAPA